MPYKHIEDQRAYHRQYMRDRREWFKNHRLCSECGEEDAYTMNGRPRCFECQSKRWKRPIEYITPEKTPKENFRTDTSRCYLCGEPVLEMSAEWVDKPLRVCAEHYEHMKRIAAMGREAYQRKEGETWGQKQYRFCQRLRKSECSEKSLPRQKLSD